MNKIEQVKVENTIIHGDSADILYNLPRNSVDLVVTSPPYSDLRKYGGVIDTWNENKFKDIVRGLWDVLKDGGVVVWIVADATIKGSETGTSFKQALWFKEIGFNIHDTMIWEKPTFTATGSLAVRYAPVFEYMFVFSKGKPKSFNPIKDKPNKLGGEKKKASTIRTSNGFKMMSKDKDIAKFGQRHNVWKISPCNSSKERTGHPAPFPEQLAQDHIISWSNPGDVVLDPFLGSGTTAKMAVLNNRHYVGFELDPQYYDIACKRLDEVEGVVNGNV